MVGGVHPVGVHGAQVLLVELDESSGELRLEVETESKLVSLKLKLARQHVEGELKDSVHGRERVGEEDEANDNGVDGVEAKRRVQRTVVDEDGEEAENIQQVHLRNAKELGGVAELPVSEFVGENGEDFVRLALLKKSIVDDNVLLPRKTVEKGVRVGAALAAVDDVELGEGELEAIGEGVDLGLELAVLERRELVEERLDEDGVGGDGKELDTGRESPEVKDKAGTSLLDNLEETSEDRGDDDGEDEVGLDHVANKEAGRLLVEAKLFFENKRAIELAGETEDLLDEDKGEDKDDGVADFAGEARRREAQQPVTRQGP